MTLRYLKNQTLPGSTWWAATASRAGRHAIHPRRQRHRQHVIGTIPGGFGDALGNIRGAEFPTWNLGISSRTRCWAARPTPTTRVPAFSATRHKRRSRRSNSTVATEVTNAALQVRSNLKRVEAASAARALAQRRLDAEQSKFEVGLSTNFFVVQAQRDLADAENIELRARLDYQKSQVEYERSQSTSLSRAGITFVGTRPEQ